MEVRSRLIETVVPDRPSGAVLVLHGGGSRQADVMVSPTQLSVLRMIPVAARCARAGGHRLAVFRLLNSVRGWDTHHTPADDARWALGEVRTRLGDVGVCLVGHSLGGRAALLAGDDPQVHSVCALAPWVYPDDVNRGLAGRRVLIVHGDRDRVARPARSRSVARGLAGVTETTYVSVRGGRHAMLRRHDVFGELAADFCATTLLDRPPTGLLERALAGGPVTEV